MHLYKVQKINNAFLSDNIEQLTLTHMTSSFEE